MARIVEVDFTGVESGGGRPKVPEGDYGLKIVKIKGKKGGDSGKNYLDIGFELTSGNPKGLKKVISHSCSLQKQSLWNLRNLLESCGKQVQSKALKLDLDKMIGLECAGTVIDDQPYEGRIKSIITAFFPLADLQSVSDGEALEGAIEEEQEEEEASEDLLAEEEEEKPKPAARKVKRRSKDEESEEDDLFS